MGCASSNFLYDSKESIYEASLQYRSKPCKRNFSKRIGSNDTSSGLDTEESNNASKFWSSTSNCSSASTPPPPPMPTPKYAKNTKPKRSLFSKISNRQMPRALAKLTLSVKSNDETNSPTLSPQHHQQQRIRPNLDQSNGYFSASTDNLESSDGSSFEKHSKLLWTQDIETAPATTTTNSIDESDSTTSVDLNEPVSNIKMEILMLRDNHKLMPKTSSPYCARRDAFACSGNASYTGTYRRWIQCLEDTPAYMFKDITAIPEAISGQFSPSNHPAYTDIWNPECVSASKRYRFDRRYDEHTKANVPLALLLSGNRMFPSTLVSTDL